MIMRSIYLCEWAKYAKIQVVSWTKTRNKLWGEERENKIYNISETELETNLPQNTRIVER